MMLSKPRRKVYKTYSHLLENKRKPSEYEIVTTKVHYNSHRDFETHGPVSAWYKKYREGSSIQHGDWELFRDPREFTYTKYTEARSRQEIHLLELLAYTESISYFEKLSSSWVDKLEFILPTLRFPLHGMQMAISYVGQMAPSGRIAITSGLQAADEIRRIQWISRWMERLRRQHPKFGEHSRDQWQELEVWQGLRRVVEELLIAYDWGEAFVALNLALKPALDRLFVDVLGSCATAEGDYVLAETIQSLASNCHWHHEWSQALLAVWETGPHAEGNCAARRKWEDVWNPKVAKAVAQLEIFFRQELIFDSPKVNSVRPMRDVFADGV